MGVLFISDLHLDAGQPATIECFLDFIEQRARGADRLYILGDLFEAWVGDDDDGPGIEPVIDALARLDAAHVPCHIMHGNRDFLLGPRFAAATGCRLLGDYECVELYGQRILLTHGDLLCTDDIRYMTLRAKLRDTAWQSDFLAKPLAERRAIADDLRKLSATETATKAEDIMDVNQAAVESTMRRFTVRCLLHGHTHRPAVHRFTLDGDLATRVVLGAWHDGATIASLDAGGLRLETL
jgi:UDP-2,3-diacylglucosamine hydrolase